MKRYVLLNKIQVPMHVHAYTSYTSVPKFASAWKIAVWE